VSAAISDGVYPGCTRTSTTATLPASAACIAASSAGARSASRSIGPHPTAPCARPIAAGVFEGGELVAFRCEGWEQNREGGLSRAAGDVEAGVDGVLAAVVAEGDSKGLARLIASEDFARRRPLLP